jgi:Family of unknown function (DUF5941)
MTAEELAATQRATGLVTDPVARDVARWAASRQMTPVTMAAIALGFGVIAAGWLTAVGMRAETIAFFALLAAFVAGSAARLMAGSQGAAETDWSVAACAVLTELAVYAGIAGSASATGNAGLGGPLGARLRATSLGGFGGPGADGVWRLAVAAVIALGLLEMTSICLAATQADTARSGRFQAFARVPGGARLVLIAVAVPLAGARVTFLLLLALGALTLVVMVVRGCAAGLAEGDSRWIVGCRGDGPLAVWIGRFVDGRLPPLPTLIVGLLVTGMLTALGLRNLPNILLATPVEAMLLASLASWHPHDGRRDWLAPSLVQAGEYVYIAAAGFAGRVWPGVTLALIAAVMLRHQELAYRSRGVPVPPRPVSDRRGLGWDGRLIVIGVATAAGFAPVVYPLLAVYLWAVVALESAVGWSGGHAAVEG